MWGEPLREIRKSIGPFYDFYDVSYSTASSGGSSETIVAVAVAVAGDQELMVYAVATEEIAAQQCTF